MAIRTGPAEVGHRMCECGHQERAHQHHRRGSDCALCSRRECAQFQPADAPLISTGRAFLSALLVIAGLYVVVFAASMLRDLP